MECKSVIIRSFRVRRGVTMKARHKGISLCSGRTVLYLYCGSWLHCDSNMIKFMELRTPKNEGAFKNRWNPNKICSLVDSIVPFPVSWIWWYAMVIADIIIGENWGKNKWKFSVFFAQLEHLIMPLVNFLGPLTNIIDSFLSWHIQINSFIPSNMMLRDN